MHLLIDIQGLQNDSRFRGIGRNTKALVEHLIRAKAPEDQITLLQNGAFEAELGLCAGIVDQSAGVQVHVWQPMVPCDWAHLQNHARRRVSEVLREFVIAKLNPDVVLVSSMVEGCADNVVTSIGEYAGPPTAAIFYDLIPLLFPSAYLTNDVLRGWYFEKLQHLKSADMLLAISESSRNEAIAHLSVEPERIVNTSSGIDRDFFGRVGAPWASLSGRFGINLPYFLYVGAGDPRKNLASLVSAFCLMKNELRDKSLLVLAGQFSDGQRKSLIALAGQAGLSKRKLIFTGHVSDDEVVALYKNALAFVFPSLHEGFGLPLLEAIAAGAPVIASNRTTSPEVLGDEAALFDPEDPSAISELMARVFSDGAFRQSLRQKQAPRLELFQWTEVAERAWLSLRQLAQRSERTKTQDDEPLNGFGIECRLIDLVAKRLHEAGTSANDFILAAKAIEANNLTVSN